MIIAFNLVLSIQSIRCILWVTGLDRNKNQLKTLLLSSYVVPCGPSTCSGLNFRWSYKRFSFL